ncbi:uncharacterized protein LOC117899123 [Drosophila subobscura]|uniref:uncharacterized protein LOC117899123 n=1 Tax=Drosophila subobscura TaxID=7241 RepID=UPI00155B14C5|nr:uncharacterized protein LOC117899123 [Drosophila subobscura]
MTLRQTSSLTLTVEQTAAGVSRTSSQTIVQFFGNEQIGCASQIYQDSNGFLTNGSQLISSSTVSQAAYTSWTPCVGVGTAASVQQQQASADTWGRNVNFGGQHIYSNEAYCNNSGQMAYNNADVYGNSLGMSHVPPHIILAPGAVAGSDFQGEYFNNGGQCTNNGEYSSQSNQNTNNYSDVYGGCLVTNCVNKNNNGIQSLARPTVGELST